MIYVLAPNNVVEQYPYTLNELRMDNPTVSLPVNISVAVAAEYNTYLVTETPQPQHNSITENVVELNPKLIDSTWVQQWVVTPATPEEIIQRENYAKQLNKDQAESLLQATDWTCTVDINNPQYSNPYLGNQDAFLAYRSQVRQIAVNPPVTVASWPVPPQEVWVSV